MKLFWISKLWSIFGVAEEDHGQFFTAAGQELLEFAETGHELLRLRNPRMIDHSRT
jgi:nuclear transport factor 2 (NTF2) superfamily protein